jgi:hypothetical protein
LNFITGLSLQELRSVRNDGFRFAYYYRHEPRSEATKQSINKIGLGYQIFFQEKPFLWIATLRAKLSLAMTTKIKKPKASLFFDQKKKQLWV